MTQKVVILRGLPASGKTTWSRAWIKKHPEYKRINRDDLRMMVYEGAWSQKKEEAVLLAKKELILCFLSAGYSLVLDDTNLDPKRMEETIEIIKYWNNVMAPAPLKAKVEIRDLTDVPLEVCLMRNENRNPKTKVPERFIRDYYNRYIKRKSP